MNKILQIWHVAERLQRLEVTQQLQTTGKNIFLNTMKPLLHLGNLQTRLGLLEVQF